MDLFDEIVRRKSVRRYSKQRVMSITLNEVEDYIENVERLYKDINLQINLVHDGEKIYKIMRGVVGSIGRISAPHYIAITSEEKEGYLENAGYAVEKVVLMLTSLGVATCWLGGHVEDEMLQGTLGLSVNQKAIALIALGYPEKSDNFTRKDSSEAKRKNFSEIVLGDIKDGWHDVIEAARLAPSAANSQPWRFVQDKSSVHVYMAENKNFITKKFLGNINRVDIGIALGHMDIAAKHFGKNSKIKKVKADKIEGCEYIASIVEKK